MKRSHLAQSAVFPIVALIAMSMFTPAASRASIETAALTGTGQNERDIGPIEVGKPIEKELSAGQAHSYRVVLTSGQYARIVVDQRGIDVRVSVFGFDKKKVMEVDSPNGERGIEEAFIVADVSGDYRIEVRSPENKALPGKYEISIVELRTATAADRDRYAAEHLYQQAEELTREGTVRSRQIADLDYQQSLAIWRRLNNPKREADALISIAMNYSDLKRLHDALNYFEQALPVLQAINDRANQGTVLNRIGRIHSLFGDHQKALEAHWQVLALTRELRDRTGEARTLSNIGTSYFNLGEAKRALYLFNEALALQQAVKDEAAEPSTLNNIAKAYDYLGDKQRALEYLEQTLRLYQKTANPHGEAVAYNNIGNIHYDLGNIQKAMDYYNKALPLWQAAKSLSGEARTLNSIGRVYAGLGDTQQALEYYNRSITLRRDLGDKSGEALVTYYIARLEGDRGNLAQAISLIESALTIIESLRAKVATQNLRASFLGSKQEYYELYIDLLMRRHRLQASARSDLEALTISERARARSLLEMLTEAGAGIREGIDPLLLSNQRKLRQQINAKATEQINLLNGRHTKQQAEAVAQQLSTLSNEYLQSEAEVRMKHPRYAALTQPQPLMLPEIQQLLDSDTLLLEYSLGAERSYLWAVTQSSIASFELPKRSEIEAAAQHLYELITVHNSHETGETIEQRRARLTQAEAQYPMAAGALSEMVLSPAASLLKTKRLLIVCEGALQYIPFGALPMPVAGHPSAAGERRSNDSQPQHSTGYLPLIIDHEIVSLPSASALAVLRGEIAGRKPAAKALAVLADPVFDKDDERLSAKPLRKASAASAAPSDSSQQNEVERSVKGVGLAGESGRISRLPFSRREAKAIMAVVPSGEGAMALDFEASRATATSSELARYRVVHFATHGLLNSEHPELSGVLFSLVDEEGKPQDGFLRLHDIYNLRLPAELVVLSACQTALGKEIRGEGLVGLTRGFMYAGATRVVASLWQVDDVATSELMRHFYRDMMREGLRPAAALQAAQIAMWKQKRWKSPYYWAAFVLQGEWK